LSHQAVRQKLEAELLPVEDQTIRIPLPIAVVSIDALALVLPRNHVVQRPGERMARLGVEGLQRTTQLAKRAGRKIPAGRKAARPAQRRQRPARKRVSAVRKAAMRRQGKFCQSCFGALVPRAITWYSAPGDSSRNGRAIHSPRYLKT
jgi:hypothetical protein